MNYHARLLSKSFLRADLDARARRVLGNGGRPFKRLVAKSAKLADRRQANRDIRSETH